MKIGVALTSSGPAASRAAVAELLDAAEDLGYDGAWFSDHIAMPAYAAEHLSTPFLEPIALCGWALARTRRLRIGTDVLVGAYRHPLLVSASAGTLAELGEDRLVLGVGIGYLRGEFELLGLPYERRAEMADDALRVLGAPVDHALVAASGTPTPVWVGGNHAAARRRAALLGDGWHPLWMPPDAYRRARAEIVEMRDRAGRTDAFTFSYSCGTTRIVDDGERGWSPPPERAPVGSEFRYVPEALVDYDGRPAFVGSPAEVIGDLRALERAGVDHVVLRPGDDVAQLELLAREVLPSFAESSLDDAARASPRP